MRKMLIVAAVLAMTIATVSPAEASRKRRRSYTRTRSTYQQTSQRPGFFARLMELERRKNDFLFGR
jgi:hypothetical protein